MSALMSERVTSVHHWNDTLFSFRTTRDRAFRFRNGHFTMIGLPVKEGRPLLRAYSIASANHEQELEFFSIKVPDGPLTAVLQLLEVGDEVLIGKKPTGTLIPDNMLPGKTLYLISTGTGLAPFMSIIKDPEIYEQYDKVILTHGVREVSELAYADYIENQLLNDEFMGEMVRQKLLYYPTVTREAYRNQGRLTDLVRTGKLFTDLKVPFPSLEDSRFMICGGPSMLKEFCAVLNDKGFVEARSGRLGHYVIERAFVES
ncbi:ferredoxin--NADP reductase [Porticoccaceae bacterium]|nr:ferredoxin--NADP reductase [Porticoccaceae bacterium]